MNTPARDRNDMSPVQQEAFSLAVSYSAYNEAMAVPEDRRSYSNWNSIAVWGASLISAQAFFGIELMPKVSIESTIIAARKAKEAIAEREF